MGPLIFTYLIFCNELKFKKWFIILFEWSAISETLKNSLKYIIYHSDENLSYFFSPFSLNLNLILHFKVLAIIFFWIKNLNQNWWICLFNIFQKIFNRIKIKDLYETHGKQTNHWIKWQFSELLFISESSQNKCHVSCQTFWTFYIVFEWLKCAISQKTSI